MATVCAQKLPSVCHLSNEASVFVWHRLSEVTEHCVHASRKRCPRSAVVGTVRIGENRSWTSVQFSGPQMPNYTRPLRSDSRLSDCNFITEFCISTFINLYIARPAYYFIPCTPAVWQLWLNEYVLLCYVMVTFSVVSYLVLYNQTQPNPFHFPNLGRGLGVKPPADGGPEVSPPEKFRNSVCDLVHFDAIWWQLNVGHWTR